MIALRASYNKARAAIDMMGQLHLATQTMVRPLAAFAGADMTVFLTRQKNMDLASWYRTCIGNRLSSASPCAWQWRLPLG
ncbi:hypothetical protein ACFS07_19795 [Undibacterium arcticum]